MVVTQNDDLTVLEHIALEDGLESDVEFADSALAAELDVSNRTVSKRLRNLESANLIEHEAIGDGHRISVTENGERALRSEDDGYQRIFDGDTELRLRGTVTSGTNEGRHYVSLPGYAQQFRERLGYEPFPGTLNVELDGESVRRRSEFSALSPIPIDGWEDDDRTYGPAVCYPVTLETDSGEAYESAHAIVPERTHHDDDRLELVAPTKLRTELAVTDGNRLTIHVKEN